MSAGGSRVVVTQVGTSRVVALGAAILLVLGVDAYVLVSEPTVVSVDDALEEFRGDRAGEVAADPLQPQPEAPAHEPPPVAPESAAAAGEHPDAPGPEAETGAPGGPVAPSEVQPPAEPAPVAPPAPAQPAFAWTRPTPGVYVYASSGYEALGIPGGRREMPPETPATVRHLPTGFSSHVQPYKEHVDLFEQGFDGPSLRLERWYAERTFAGQTVAQDHRCPESEPAYVHGAAPGRTARMLCTWDDRARTEGTMTFVGYEDVVLRDGTTVAGAVRILVENTTRGEVTGTARNQLWFHPETGLLLREIRSLRSSNPTPFGRVDYAEDTRFDLVSLTPRT